MDEAERAHLETLVTTYTRRLQHLEVQRAKTGNATDPSVLIEIEDIQNILKELSERMQRGSVVTINLVSFIGAATSGGANERLDLSSAFQPVLPTPETWATIVLPQFNELKQRLASEDHRVVAVRPKAHLSVGYAFGYTFRATTGFDLWVEQPVRHTGQSQWWRTDEQPAPGTPLELERASGPSKSKHGDTSIEVSATPDVDIRTAVKQTIAGQQLPIRQRIQFCLPMGESGAGIQNGQHALAMALQIRAAIRKARNDHPQQTIHLFGAMPIGLAILLGANLNACEPVQCYEYDRTSNTYQPSCLLTPELAT